MAETNWENWYRANPNPSSGADRSQESVPDWMSWIDNPLFQDSSSLTPAPPATGRWSLSEEPEPLDVSPIEPSPQQAPALHEESITTPGETETPPSPDSIQATKPIPTIKQESPSSPNTAPETQSLSDDTESLQTFVVSSILPLTRRPRKNMKPSASKELSNDDAQQSDNNVPETEESHEDEHKPPEQLSDNDVAPDMEPPADIIEEYPVEETESKENNLSFADTIPTESEGNNLSPSDEIPQESPETVENDIAPAEEPPESFSEETVEVKTEQIETSPDSHPEEEPTGETGNTIAFPLHEVTREETDNGASSPEKSAEQEKKQTPGFLQKMQSFWVRRSQTSQTKTSDDRRTSRASAPTRPPNPDRPHNADRPRNDRSRNIDRPSNNDRSRPRPVEPLRQEPTRNLKAVRNDRIVMQERRETERILSKEREKKERARERERLNRKKRAEERRLEMERIQNADPRDPNFRRSLSENDIFGGAEAEYMYAFSSQRHRQDTQGRNMEHSRTDNQSERHSNYSAVRSGRDGQRASNASLRSVDSARTGQQTRRTGQAQNTGSATRNRRRKGPNYRLILCVIMLIAIALDFVFLGMFLFQRNQATGLNGQIETLTKDKETLTTQVGALTQENTTLEANMMSALPEPTTARTDNLPDLIPQLTDGIYLIHVSDGYQYLKVPDGYLTDKINSFADAAGYAATNAAPPTCSYYVLYANKVVGLAEGDTGLVSEDRTATGAGSTLPSGFYAFVASFFNN